MSGAASSLLADLDVEATAGAPLSPWTSLRVGGPAELLVRPGSPDALAALLSRAREAQVPLAILGGGANTLIGDLGIAGLTLKLPSDWGEAVEPREGGVAITLPAGASIARLIVLMKSQRVVGAEFLAGIPGTIGGAVAMNAGTQNGECLSVIEAVEVATPEGVGWRDRSALRWGYRRTELPPFGVLTRARFFLPKGDLEESQRRIDADLGYRKRTQPLDRPNCGSVFENPPGDHAGRLIESVGLKGHRIGGAQISTLHANWIVNLGGARAADVVGLIELAQGRVREATGIALRPEVKRVGRFA